MLFPSVQRSASRKGYCNVQVKYDRVQHSKSKVRLVTTKSQLSAEKMQRKEPMTRIILRTQGLSGECGLCIVL